MKKRRLFLAFMLMALGMTLGACTTTTPPEPPEESTSVTSPEESQDTPTEEPTQPETEPVTLPETEPETQPQPVPIDRSEYPKEQAGGRQDILLSAADYGVKGDGVTDDGPAIGRAVEAAVAQGATLVFESGKTYYIGSTDRNAGSFRSPFAMSNAKGVTVDGQGSVFRFAPGICYFAMVENADIRFCNMKLDMAISPYLVGQVTAVAGKYVTYSTDLEPYKEYTDSRSYVNFSIAYNEGTQQRPHRFIETMEKVGSRELKVAYEGRDHGYEVGDTVYLPNPGIGNYLGEISYIGYNTGCLVFENIEVRAAPTFIFNIRSNDAEIYFENVDFLPDPEGGRAIQMVSWRDGYHVKDNRRPIHWNECDVGVLFDDVFNVSNTLGYITALKNGNQFSVVNFDHYNNGVMVPFDCRAGDVVEVFSADGVYAGKATVRGVSENPNGSMELVLEYGEVLEKAQIGWRVGNHETCAPGSTVTNSRFTGTFRFRRDIRIENCEFDMLLTWILEDGSVEGPIPGNLDYVNCTFRGGHFEIGAEGVSVRAAMKDIGFWGCRFEDGARIIKVSRFKAHEADEWTEEELFTYKNRRMTTVPTLVTPEELDLANTVVYDWTRYLMKVEGGVVCPVSGLEDASLRERLEVSSDFSDRVLVLEGGEQGTRFTLDGLSSEALPFFHEKGREYVITLHYYTPSEGASGCLGVWKGETAEALAEGIFTAVAPGNKSSTATVHYKATEGCTGLYIEVPAGMTVYVGRLSLSATSSKNPSQEQFFGGHTFVWSEDLSFGRGGKAMAYEEIQDEAVRTAIQNADSGFTSGVVLHVKGDLGEFTGMTYKEYYVPGKTYHLSLDAYIASPLIPKDGTRIYLLAMDDTPGNRVLAEGLFTGEGFYHFEMDWTVGKSGERALKLYISNTPEAYADLYIGDFTVSMSRPMKPDVFLTRQDYHTLTTEEMRAGYTFDFTEGNLMDTGVESYASTNVLPYEVASVLREHGFGDVVYYVNENFTMQSLPDELTGGKRFVITFRVYDILGNLASTLPEGAFVLLHMQKGVQNSAGVHYTVEADPDNSRFLTLTLRPVTPGATDDLLFYSLTSMEFLIGSVTIQQLN